MSASYPEIVGEKLRRSFGDREVLHGISLAVNSGEIVGIVGSSGCGKTVLLSLLTGLMPPDSGRVLVADHDHVETGKAPPMLELGQIDDDELDRVRLHWAVVFQKNALFTGTVENNITLWLREHTKLTPAEIARRVRDSLGAVALDVDDVLKKQREELSGGMAKRVAIARAIAVDPIVTFYDEPTTGLDPVVGGQMHDLIWDSHHRPRAGGGLRTTIIVTHDKDLLRRMRPRIIMLDKGEVAFEGSYEQFHASNVEAARMYLRAMPVLHARHAE